MGGLPPLIKPSTLADAACELRGSTTSPNRSFSVPTGATWLCCRAMSCGRTQRSDGGTPISSLVFNTAPGSRIATACHSRHIRLRACSSSSVYKPWSSKTICTPWFGVRVEKVIKRFDTHPLFFFVPLAFAMASLCRRTSMFPGCGSPCTNPWHSRVRAKVSARASAAALGSIPAALRPGPSSIFAPRINSIVNTLSVVRFQ